MDQMMEMMEKYANNLEDIVNERTRLLCEEKKKTEDLLYRMLPKTVAANLTKGHGVEPVSYSSVCISVFCDCRYHISRSTQFYFIFICILLLDR